MATSIYLSEKETWVFGLKRHGLLKMRWGFFLFWFFLTSLKAAKWPCCFCILCFVPRPKKCSESFQLMVLGTSAFIVDPQLGNQRYCHTVRGACSLSLASRNLQCWGDPCVVCREMLPTPKMGICFVLYDHLLAKSSSSVQTFLMPETNSSVPQGWAWLMLQVCKLVPVSMVAILSAAQEQKDFVPRGINSNRTKTCFFPCFVLKDELIHELKQTLNAIKLEEKGVYVQASTLGSLEALLEFLKTSEVPVSTSVLCWMLLSLRFSW